jgi:hypothetical protein
MGIQIKPSDLCYRYGKNQGARDLPKFLSPSDPQPFDRNDLYELIPMFEKVMDALGTRDARVLQRMEEILIRELPAFINRRDTVYQALLTALRDVLDECPWIERVDRA